MIFPSAEASYCSIFEKVRDTTILYDAHAPSKLYSWNLE